MKRALQAGAVVVLLSLVGLLALRLALISALSFMGELQSPFIWDIGGHSTLIFSGPSRSTSIRCARSLRS